MDEWMCTILHFSRDSCGTSSSHFKGLFAAAEKGVLSAFEEGLVMLLAFSSPVLVSCTQKQCEPRKSIGLADTSTEFLAVCSAVPIWEQNLSLSHSAWICVCAMKPPCSGAAQYCLKSLKFGKISSSLSFRPCLHGLVRNWAVGCCLLIIVSTNNYRFYKYSYHFRNTHPVPH